VAQVAQCHRHIAALGQPLEYSRYVEYKHVLEARAAPSLHLPGSHSKRNRSYIPTTPPNMPSLPAVPPKPHRRPVALFPPDSEEDEYDLPGLVTKRSVEKAPAALSKGSDDEEDTAQMDNEEDTAQMDHEEDTAQMDDQEHTAQTDNEDTAQTDNEEDTAQTEEDTAQMDNEEDTAQMDHEEDTAQMDDQEHTAQTDNEEDTAQTDNEEDTAQTDNEDDNDEEVTKKASSSKGRAGATNLTPTQWAVIVSMD
jgi:hypothetical protein